MGNAAPEISGPKSQRAHISERAARLFVIWGAKSRAHVLGAGKYWIKFARGRSFGRKISSAELAGWSMRVRFWGDIFGAVFIMDASGGLSYAKRCLCTVSEGFFHNNYCNGNVLLLKNLQGYMSKRYYFLSFIWISIGINRLQSASFCGINDEWVLVEIVLKN